MLELEEGVGRSVSRRRCGEVCNLATAGRKKAGDRRRQSCREDV